MCMGVEHGRLQIGGFLALVWVGRIEFSAQGFWIVKCLSNEGDRRFLG